LFGAFEVAAGIGKRRFGAKQLHPAGAPQQLRHLGFRDQRLVLDQAALDQRQFGHRAVQRPRRRRRQIIAHQPRQECRKIGQVVAHLRRAVRRVAQDLAKIPRKHVGKHRRAFDQSAVSKAGLFAGDRVLVDQDHIAAPLLQMQRSADADHARTQDEYIGLQFRHRHSES
jgi:hypothetical protein